MGMNSGDKKVIYLFWFALLLFVPVTVWAEENTVLAEEPTLKRAVMAETIHKFAPINVAVVFSLELGRVYCFTEFDPVPVQSVTYHKWYRGGSLVSVKQLTLNPPRWSSFSSIQLRELDKGPWQVEVIGEKDRLLRTLRFSITD
jgi:hypothetical protein